MAQSLHSFSQTIVRSLVLSFVLIAFGCGDLHVDGSAEGEGRLALSWAEPELGLVHGSGRLDEGKLSLSVSDRPPRAAFHRGLAIAELVLLAPDAAVNLGRPLQVESVASDLVLIYRAPDAVDRWWSAEFPEGYSCGQAQIGADGEVGYAPVSCRGLRLQFVDRAALEDRPRRD